MRLNDQTILLTGATSGIGLQLLEQLAPNNQVLAVARPSARLEDLARTHPGVKVYPADLSDMDQVLALADAVIRDNVRLDALINNAGVQNTPYLTDPAFDLAAMVAEITLNFTAICGLSQRLLPLLRKSPEASIVNVSSGLALAPKTNSAVYCGTKSALDGFSRSLRYQLDDTSVQVFQAFMPLVDTPMTAGRGSGKIAPSQAAADLIAGVRRGTPDLYIGKAALLYWIMRLSPALGRRLMRRL